MFQAEKSWRGNVHEQPATHALKTSASTMTIYVYTSLLYIPVNRIRNTALKGYIPVKLAYFTTGNNNIGAITT